MGLRRTSTFGSPVGAVGLYWRKKGRPVASALARPAPVEIVAGRKHGVAKAVGEVIAVHAVVVLTWPMTGSVAGLGPRLPLDLFGHKPRLASRIDLE
jgi:hypothetical protein